MKFILVYQTNSGGYMINNEDVGYFTFIETDSVKNGLEKFKTLNSKEDDICTCYLCGPRYDLYDLELEETDNIENYIKELTFNFLNIFIVIHYNDGTKSKFEMSKIANKEVRLENVRKDG